MARATVILQTLADRQKAAKWAMTAPAGTRTEWKEPKRTLPQNDRMWAMLTDIATQLRWHGVKLDTDDWKLVMLDALRRETNEPLRIVPNLDGSGFVNLNTSSSDLSKGEMSDLIEIMYRFGASHGVVWSNPDERRRAAA